MPEALAPAQALYIGMEVVIAVFSVLGNVMVVWAVKINKSLRDTTFCFIVSLALADIAVGALVIPLAITISIGLQTHFYSCLMVACTVLVLTQSSILALLAIAIDRYLRVKIPTSYKRVVTKLTPVVVCWTVAFIVGLDSCCYWNNLWRCCTPLLLMLVIYTEIFYMIHKQLNKKACTISHTDPNKYYDKELKLAKSLALVLFLFAISWLPLHIINCITLFCPTCDKPLFLVYMAILLTHGNSAVNPIVYAFRIKKFRDAFLKIWKQYFCCKDVPAILNQPSEKDRKENENQNGNGNPNPIGDSPPAPSPSQEGQQLPLEQMVKHQQPQKPPMEHNNI
ncbi:adenosine receptor A1-like [Oncorhynchus masou masou]|uniref:adenosine receptor A1-like n=1 Tax=Oncorhynchus masou masou TaxID=90313 RepID=UPI0031836B8A